MKIYIKSKNSILKEEKNRAYNQSQTEVGHALKTLNGSTIKRSKFGVGKDIGGQLYFHKDYASFIVPQEDLDFALNVLNSKFSAFKYNCMMWDYKKNILRFDSCPDFDTAREPMVGDYIAINLENGNIREGSSKYIFHHKWLWVMNDYTGFDVSESWNWSKTWLSVLKEPSDGNGIARWNAQLDKYDLPHDK